MKTEYTPGPWKSRGIFIFVPAPSREVIAKVSNTADSTLNWKCPASSFENLANARLIAAAPDMLEALKDLLVMVKQKNAGDYSGNVDTSEAIKAIKQATGEN